MMKMMLRFLFGEEEDQFLCTFASRHKGRRAETKTETKFCREENRRKRRAIEMIVLNVRRKSVSVKMKLEMNVAIHLYAFLPFFPFLCLFVTCFLVIVGYG